MAAGWLAVLALVWPLSRACYKFSADMPDPCIEKECHFGGTCRPLSDGRSAECVCPSQCPTYGDSRGSRPVCGTNGLDFPNECQLRRAACSQLREIGIKFEGKCDPCDGIQCASSQVCQLDDSRNPICRCNALCSPELKPVCGSDGRTYTNECALRVEACKSRRSLRIIYTGECSSGAQPCESVVCGPGQECDIDRYGIAKCECPPPCEPVMTPVCGSDGKTYDSECQLRRTACFQQQHISLAYRGLCGEEGPCHSHECEYGAICVLRSGVPSCECPSCSEEFLPACGSDGITYSNPCKLRKEACDRKTDISQAKEGICAGCQTIHCDYYAVCKSDGSSGNCMCPEFCIEIDSPICGTDGVTYKNECEMKKFSCKKQQYIAVATRGACDLCLNVHCKYGARCENGHCVCPTECPDTFEPVCANDGITYPNECDMRKNACHLTTELNALFYGECDDIGSSGIDLNQDKCEKNCHYGGVCQYNREGYLRCTCNFQCPQSKESICGSDGRVYDNECMIKQESCKQQLPLHPVKCPVNILEPKECDGEQPLRDPVSGKFYACKEKADCPPSSYCHDSICCRLVAIIKECDDSTYGCCPDGKTISQGHNNAGCPSTCNCNRLGSYGASCDAISGQCFCKAGVGGTRCDRCEAGYWGLHKIADGNNGCAPCGCNDHGSVRDDCEQMTGRCVCKHGIQGMKCDICPTGTVLGPEGCMDASIAKPVPGNCHTLHCYHGAKCREKGGRAQCICDMHCSPEDNRSPICGADDNTYSSECQLRLFSCRYQKPINIRNFGPCKTDDDVSPTAGPVRRSTVHKPTGDQFEPKSTRDITLSLPETLFLSTRPTTIRPLMEDIPVEVPAFSGKSFLEFTRLQAYSRLSVELEFRTFLDHGILLYNGQTATRNGDFVSLAIRDGYVEFRYNLGSGPVILRSPQKIQPGRFHRLVAKRYLQDGMIALDGHDDVTGRSQGLLKSLDLGENLFLGNVPTDNNGIWENIGVKSGLVGCIRRLKVGRKILDLHFPTSKDILRANSIRECSDNPCEWKPCRNSATCIGSAHTFLQCSCLPKFTGRFCDVPLNPCYNNPCKDGSTCKTLTPGSFTCVCPSGNRGRFCEIRYHEIISPYTPEFDGHGYLELPTLQNVGQGFTLELWFMPRSNEGLLFYNGQLSVTKGDFIALYFSGGNLFFTYDLGSGMANITGKEKISLNEWHKVVVSRSLRQGTLQLDSGEIIQGQSKGSLSELNLDLPLYIGGLKENSAVNPEAGIPTSGLDGILQRIILNEQIWDDFKKFPKSFRMKEYKGPPCYPNPCSKVGVCEPLMSKYVCHCPSTYSGRQCETCDPSKVNNYCLS